MTRCKWHFELSHAQRSVFSYNSSLILTTFACYDCNHRLTKLNRAKEQDEREDVVQSTRVQTIWPTWRQTNVPLPLTRRRMRRGGCGISHSNVTEDNSSASFLRAVLRLYLPLAPFSTHQLNSTLSEQSPWADNGHYRLLNVSGVSTV